MKTDPSNNQFSKLNQSLIASVVLHLALWLWLVHVGYSNTAISSAYQLSLGIIDSPANSYRSQGFNEAQKTTSRESKHKALKNRSSSNKTTATENLDAHQANATTQSAATDKNGTGSSSLHVHNPEYVKYIQDLRTLIWNKKTYPEYSLRLREHGNVKVAITIDASGVIKNVELLEACPFQRLNNAAVSLVKDIGRFKPFPTIMASHRELKFEIPLEYVIR